MSKHSYLDAVFALFGDDELTDEFKTVFIGGSEPTNEELDEILGSWDSAGETAEDDRLYCQRVHDALIDFTKDPSGYIAKMSDTDPKKVALVEILTMQAQTTQVAVTETQAVKAEPEKGVDPLLSDDFVTRSETTVSTTQITIPVRTTPTGRPGTERTADKGTPSTGSAKGERADASVPPAAADPPEKWDDFTQGMQRSMLTLDYLWIPLRDGCISAVKEARSEDPDHQKNGQRRIQIYRRYVTRYRNDRRPVGKMISYVLEFLIYDLLKRRDLSHPHAFRERYEIFHD